jgi:hypothetical protein
MLLRQYKSTVKLPNQQLQQLAVRLVGLRGCMGRLLRKAKQAESVAPAGQPAYMCKPYLVPSPAMTAVPPLPPRCRDS